MEKVDLLLILQYLLFHSVAGSNFNRFKIIFKEIVVLLTEKV